MSEASEPVRRKTSRWKIALRIMVPIFLLLALAGGMVFGYVILGKQDIGEAFKWSTWKHVFDLVFAP
ncbi:DNA-directed RNA polymerase subunit beta [Paenibacillus uliginis N3/975]|uniref:DNA-directed RNA polymerase subunit beta n=1 Tax=Paenibacillus uliginis N3/975 TaxID=1313296 RepID=A0A1X7GAX3_9BACL|nr:DNA-directed RNA polymerase subunit beta [Paenibacillus uliginis]SMF66991.1 DNA-directed RNA polymerase subunit beta [Paenibacillus uliginis N3/975]